MGMMYQRSPGMRPEIKEYGCYFMSLIEAAAKRRTDYLFTVEAINAIYDTCVFNGWMREDCYIIDPAAILKTCGIAAVYKGKFPHNRVCGDDEFEILHYTYRPKSWHHFVGGNGFGMVAYDPWGISLTATQGQLVSKRIFKVG